MHLPASGLLRPFSTITLLPACAPGPAADRCLFYSSIRETIEFHLLSLRENPDPRKEIGLMASYLSLTAKVFTSIIFASSLDPIKNLLLSEWLQSEWQRAKDAASKSVNEATGGEVNA